KATRADLGERHLPPVSDARLRVQRLPAALERALVFRDESRDRDRRRGAGCRSLHPATAARRRRCDRRDAVAILRPARRRAAGVDDGAGCAASAVRAAAGYERPAWRRTPVEAGRTAAPDAVLSELHPA